MAHRAGSPRPGRAGALQGRPLEPGDAAARGRPARPHERDPRGGSTPCKTNLVFAGDVGSLSIVITIVVP